VEKDRIPKESLGMIMCNGMSVIFMEFAKGLFQSKAAFEI
jgi:hypothetical protein